MLIKNTEAASELEKPWELASQLLTGKYKSILANKKEQVKKLLFFICQKPGDRIEGENIQK